MLKRLKLDELEVESFSTTIPQGRGTVVGHQVTHFEGGCTTHSLDYATHCNCSGGPQCTLDCVEVSQATEEYRCCG
jgi:hypothetical protein